MIAHFFFFILALLLPPAGSQAGGSQDLARFFKRLALAKPHELPAECGRVRLFIEDSAGWRQEESWMVCNMLGAGEPTGYRAQHA